MSTESRSFPQTKGFKAGVFCPLSLPAASEARDSRLESGSEAVIEVKACFKWLLSIDASGSGRGGMSSTAGGLTILFASKSINQTSSGRRKFFLNLKNEAGTPIIYGVGASNNWYAKQFLVAK